MGEQYQKVSYIFSGLEPHTVSSESLIEKPYRDGDVFIEAQILLTLDDGKHLELCLWSADGAAYWDVSAEAAEFPGCDEADFLRYLGEKGVCLESAEDRLGGKWRWLGLCPREDVFRVRYLEEE